MLSIQDWHNRFSQQAGWTKGIREYLLNKSHIHMARSILEVGCGTGALLGDIEHDGPIHGLDINLARLQFAEERLQKIQFICGDAHHLPYPNNFFTHVYCHFLLLWVKSPERILREMVRVGEPGGYVIMMAEPDYGGRIDYPDSLKPLGKAQAESLKLQGADPNTGRKLSGWLYAAGLKEIEVGVLGGQWENLPSRIERELEWQVLESDLANVLNEEKLEYYKNEDTAAWEDGSRMLYVPTFYGIGIIP